MELSGWDSFLGGLGNTVNAGLNTYLQSQVRDPAAEQYTVSQTPNGPNLQNSANPGSLGGLSPIVMVGIAVAAVAALGVVVYAVKS